MLIQKMDGLAATVKGGFDETRAEVKGGFDETRAEVRAGFAEVKGELDNMAKTLQDSNMCIKNLLAPNYPYPHLAVVKEVETGGKRGFMGKLRGVAKKDMTLRFLCPVDMSEVPCGVGGEGYRFRQTRGWVKKICPVLQVSCFNCMLPIAATKTRLGSCFFSAFVDWRSSRVIYITSIADSSFGVDLVYRLGRDEVGLPSCAPVSGGRGGSEGGAASNDGGRCRSFGLLAGRQGWGS